MPKPVDNPPNPWASTHVEYLEEPPPARLEVFEEKARSVITANDSPDVGFRYSVNPYRGCIHACSYCYARPSHQYLGYGAGTDFDRKIVAKVNAPELLRREFLRPSWAGDLVVFSGNTDCYQPLEANYELTRRCLEVCLEFRNPVGIITKGALVARDLALLASLAREADAMVWMSVAFDDDAIARKLEPFATPPSRRFAIARRLADAGVRVGLAVAPVIPGLNDAMLPSILEQGRAAGARSAFMTLLRLPREVLPVFRERVAQVMPERAAKIDRGVREVRSGTWNDSTFGARMHGHGARWAAIEALFALHRKRLGLDDPAATALRPGTFRRPSRQGSLFDP